MAINIFELINLPENELNKLTKSEIIESIKAGSWNIKYQESQVKGLREELEKSRSDEVAACVVLASYCGVNLPREEYSGKIEVDKLNLLELVGYTLSKVSQE